MRPIYTALKRIFMKQAVRHWERVPNEHNNSNTLTFTCGGDRLSINFTDEMAFLYESWGYPNVNCVSIRFANTNDYEDFRAVFNATQKEIAACGTTLTA